MLTPRKTNFVKRLLFGCNDASFLRTHIIKVILQQSSIVLVVIWLHDIGLHGIGKKSIEDFFRTILLYLLGNASFDLEPSLLEQTWPHVDALYGL